MKSETKQRLSQRLMDGALRVALVSVLFIVVLVFDSMIRCS